MHFLKKITVKNKIIGSERVLENISLKFPALWLSYAMNTNNKILWCTLLILKI
jgi:hypothetical protein